MKRRAWIVASCGTLFLWHGLACIGPVARGAVEGDVVLGEAIYRGTASISGRLEGRTTPLPPQALACMNCHEAAGDGRGSAPAPSLRNGWLSRTLSRRNGPVGSYDEAGFCRTLAKGIDPQGVSLPSLMPRFEVSAAECLALWAYLARQDAPTRAPAAPASS